MLPLWVIERHRWVDKIIYATMDNGHTSDHIDNRNPCLRNCLPPKFSLPLLPAHFAIFSSFPYNFRCDSAKRYRGAGRAAPVPETHNHWGGRRNQVNSLKCSFVVGRISHLSAGVYIQGKTKNMGEYEHPLSFSSFPLFPLTFPHRATVPLRLLISMLKCGYKTSLINGRRRRIILQNSP